MACSPGLLWPIPLVQAEELVDPEIRAAMLKRNNGLIAHVETVYNDIFVGKNRNLLILTFHWKGYYFQESQVNLADPDDLPLTDDFAPVNVYDSYGRRYQRKM